MTWKPGPVCRRLLYAVGVAGAIVFSLPGGAVLAELVWQATGVRLGESREAVFGLAAALLVAVWLFSPHRVLCSTGWAIALMGHAAMANATSPGRGVDEQLAWLGGGAVLGAAIGSWLVRRQSRKAASACQVVTGAEGQTATSHAPAWRYQVTLPMLGFWAAAAALLLILLARDHQRVAWQDRMTAAVSQSRGHVVFDDFAVPTLVLPWGTRRLEDEEDVRKCLRCIDLGSKAGDEQLSQLFELGLKQLPNLSEIRLDRSLVTDNGLVIVAPLVRLEGLSLGPAITNVGLRHLNGLTALRTLDLSRTQLTAGGLRYPRQLPLLQTLSLRNTKINDEDLAQLARFPRLVRLDLAGTPISDAGLIHLTDLPYLQSLVLERTHISDAGVEQLQKMPSLHWLFVSHTRLTESGAKALVAARPGLVVQQ